MKGSSIKRISHDGSPRRAAALAAILSCLLVLQGANAVAPGWWSTRNVLTTAQADDFAVLNQGQLKNIVRAAIEEINDKLPDKAGNELDGLLAQWRATPGNDYDAVNLGQLKAMGKLVRSRLEELGLPTDPMGTASLDDDDDFALANVGQAKTVFALQIDAALGSVDSDYDNDGLTRGQEITLGTNPRMRDTDGDGLYDGQEVTLGTNPLIRDTDGDGIEDGQEVALGTNPKVKDTDGDGLEDGYELTLGTNPKSRDSDGDGEDDGQEMAQHTNPTSASSSLASLVGLRVFTPIEPL